MGKFRHFLTECSARHMSTLLFPDKNLSKCQWIFKNLGVCIDIVKIRFGIANGKIPSFFDRVICPSVCRTSFRPYVRPSVFRFRMITSENINGLSPSLACALILWRSGLSLLMG